METFLSIGPLLAAALGAEVPAPVQNVLDWVTASPGMAVALGGVLVVLLIAAASARVRGFLGGLIQVSLVALAGLYGFLVFVHFSNGFDASRSMELPTQDLRMGLACFAKPDVVWMFVNRKPGHDVGLQQDQQAGVDIYAAVCAEGDLAPDTTATLGRVGGVPAAETATPQASATAPAQGDEALQELRLYMLSLINADRTAHGLSPVALGANPAAQEHADDMVLNDYISHWGTDGLRPYMRYTLAGGTDYEAENVSYACYSSGGRGWRLQEALAGAQEGLMNSPGHRDNILNPRHTHVNIGIASNRQALAVVQQFEGDYMDVAVAPTLADDGTVRLSGRIKDGGEAVSIHIWRNETPEPLRRQQLLSSRTYGLAGEPVAFIRPPAPLGSFYTRAEATYQYTVPIDPQQVSADGPEPPACAIGDVTPTGATTMATATVPWVNAVRWSTNADGRFDIAVNIGDVLRAHGPGVYTVVLWADFGGGESVAATNYSLFIE